MNVSLTSKLEELIREKVDSGFYGSASEVVREALRLLDQRDRLQERKLDALRRDIDEGIEELDAGLGEPFDIESIRSEGRRTLERQRAKKGQWRAPYYRERPSATLLISGRISPQTTYPRRTHGSAR